MEILSRRRARITLTEFGQADARVFALMAVVGAMPVMGRAANLFEVRDWPSSMFICGGLYALIASVLPLGLALVSMRAPRLAARRVSPLMVPFTLLWVGVLPSSWSMLVVWPLVVWPLVSCPYTFLALAVVVLSAVVMGAFFADIGMQFLTTHRRDLVDWVAGLALLLPVVGFGATIAWVAVQVWI